MNAEAKDFFCQLGSGINDWTEQDAAQMTAFLNSPTGYKLIASLLNETGVLYERACIQFTGKKFHAGLAAGFGHAVNSLKNFSLSAQSEESQTSNTEGQDGAPDILERYAP